MVPVLGQDLLTITDSATGVTRPLFPYLAERVASHLGVSGADLPFGDELVEIARRAVLEQQSSQAIYHAVRKVFRELEPLAVPAPLARLAEIPKLKLFVTTTFDGLIERALDEARFDGRRHTLAFVYAPNDKQDLPPELDRLKRPAVFYLMGKVSATPRSYAVTREDILEFTESLQSKAEDAPFFLFDKLGSSDLLFIGTRVADWLAHLFARNPEVARRVDAASNGGATPVVFLDRASGTAHAYPGGDASAFVFELYDRFRELEASESSMPPEILAELSKLGTLAPGAVVVSCARSDRDAAEPIREALDRAGVDVVLDTDDVELAPKWELKLKHCLCECSLFVPLFSERSSQAVRRWTQQEWSELLLKSRARSDAQDFVFPYVLDDSDPPSLPSALAEAALAETTTLQGNEAPSEAFVSHAIERQRRYRRAVGA